MNTPLTSDDPYGEARTLRRDGYEVRYWDGGTTWGSETPNRSCGEAVVLVDEPIEQVAPPDIARVGRDRLPGRCER